MATWFLVRSIGDEPWAWLAKGTASVLATGVLLHRLIERAVGRVEEAHRRLQGAYAEVERLSLVFRHTSDAVIALRSDGRVEYRNPAAERLARELGVATVDGLLGTCGREVAFDCLASGSS